ncbi:MAG: amidohydrolase family protein [Frankia sp.]|nr:amidohydrolase family protein [Frankia sp.]
MTPARTVLHLAPVVLPITAEPVYDGAVAVSGDRISAVGTRADLVSAHPGARVREWMGTLTPGLVNAHTHLQYTDFADLATSGLAFPEWIRTLTERRRTWQPRQWQASVRRGVHELLRTGTTSAADVVTDVAGLSALARSGLAGRAYLEIVGVESEHWSAARDELTGKLDAVPAGMATGVSPHAIYSLGTTVARGVAALARERGLRLHPHLAETEHEHAYVTSGRGPIADFGRARSLTFELIDNGTGISPVAHADALGWLGSDTHIAHGVHVDAADRALLRERGTAVALCVRSNAVLGAGTPPVAAYLREDNALAVGTDSRASVPTLDLLDDVAALHALARAQGYDAPDLARRLLTAATQGGADAIGCPDAGRLAAGTRADLAVFDVPADVDPYDAIVEHGPGRCAATVLAGRIVHRRVASPA